MVSLPSSLHNTSNRPDTIVNHDYIPSELRGIGNWLYFTLSYGADGKLQKEPRSGRRRGAAKCDDPATWCSFGQALRLTSGKSGHTLGFALPEDQHMTVIDLDHCRDRDTGAIAAWARPILARFAGTHCEISPSGTGLHIWLLGTKPARRCKLAMPDGGALEVYSGGPKQGRMVTITGDRFNDAPVMLAAMQVELEAFCAEIFPAKTPKATPAHAPVTSLTLDDTELLTRARNHPDPLKAERFRALYDRGDILGYKSLSERDLACCNDLAYMCGPGAEDHVADLFRASACYREKADRDDYVNRTVAKAYEGKTAFYRPRSVEPQTSENQIEKPAEPCAYGGDELAAARVRIAELEAENAALRAQQSAQPVNDFRFWVDELIAIPERRMSASEKLVAIAMRRKAERTHHDIRRADDSWKVSQAEIADQTGFSTSTVSKAWQRWGKAESGPYQLDQPDELVPVKMKDPETGAEHVEMQWRTMTYAKLHPAIIQPKAWIPPDGERDRGGKRKNAGRPRACVKCGSTAITERVLVETVERKVRETRCPDCKSIKREHIGHEELVNIRVDETPVTEGENQIDFDTSAWPEAAAPAQQDDVPPCVEASIGQQIDFAVSDASGESTGNQFENDAPNLNHHDERVELLDCLPYLNWMCLPIAPRHVVGGTYHAWKEFAQRAPNHLIDAALLTVRPRIRAKMQEVS